MYYNKCKDCGANLDPGERCGCVDKIRWTTTKSVPQHTGDYWVLCGRGTIANAYWNGKKWFISDKKLKNMGITHRLRDKTAKEKGL